MKLKKEKGAIANNKNSKKNSSLKKKIIISYTMVLSFMFIIATVCITQMKNVITELVLTQDIINNAAVQTVTKQNMRASITILETSVSKFSKHSYCSFNYWIYSYIRFNSSNSWKYT